eukprot:CAMPEP_0172618958 /NCGR_PEP_ID=MMETSP1068-20121228/88443_1 /TAXON_ID=35684 /ORGANISM="Pseudopedinella elastica, Strain CCMP716" /LENGTH=86 /DNA_ID=CAMNT_0013425473 /DNA_START=208 /DNA_END=470 /DNA_ORIENTATION=+
MSCAPTAAPFPNVDVAQHGRARAGEEKTAELRAEIEALGGLPVPLSAENLADQETRSRAHKDGLANSGLLFERMVDDRERCDDKLV